MSEIKFGRIDDELNVYVLDAGVERKIGQMPGSTEAEALAFFTRKFEDLAAQVRLLEQRVKARADAASLKASYTKLEQELTEPNALGDLTDLRARLTALTDAIEALHAEKAEANKEAVAAALATREALVIKAEELANTTSNVIWKKASADFTALFEQWQSEQKNSPRVPKAEADALWKRFSAARNKFDAAKRAFFSTQDAAAKVARDKKEALVAKAEALAADGSDSTNDFKALLADWKAAGRAGTKVDDALWTRFKAAGDAIHAKRAEKSAEISASQQEAFAAKLELLKEANKIDPKKDLEAAKRALLDIQKKWAAAGRVSKEQLKDTDDKLKAIERSVREAEADHWRKTDPAAKARTNSVVTQLEESIEKLKAELEKAKAAKDAKKISDAEEALAAREAWLATVLATQN